MNKVKYFRVRKRTNRKGDTIYQTQSADSIWDIIFVCWSEYQKENETLEDAISQIETISEHKIEEDKIVYKKTIR